MKLAAIGAHVVERLEDRVERLRQQLDDRGDGEDRHRGPDLGRVAAGEGDDDRRRHADEPEADLHQQRVGQQLPRRTALDRDVAREQLVGAELARTS